ncbi:MAG: hypothetical protein HC780_26415, partial [Leptolyngbyaceae cyanobacterium CSU_1_3]|nr:hypothetical protein [Leptolyngbyaceae cyanobacterium CSU_1_3]
MVKILCVDEWENEGKMSGKAARCCTSSCRSRCPLRGRSGSFPSPIKFLEMAREQPSAHVDIEKPFWWDMPTWVATGKVDSIGLANTT